MANHQIRFLFLVILAPIYCLAQLTGQAATERLRSLVFPRAESFVANGVDTGTGAFTMESQVMEVDGGRPVPIVIRYNSLLNIGSKDFSPGWSHDYEASISGDPNNIVNVNLDSARRVRFRANGGSYTPLDEGGLYDKLTRSGSIFTYTKRDGTIYEFDAQNRLSRLGNKVRQFLEFKYNEFDELIEIKEPIANRILKVYPRRDGSGHIQSIVDQEDRILYFGYDQAGRLSAVHPPTTLTPTPITNPVSLTIPDNNSTGITRNFNFNETEPMGLLVFGSGLIAHDRPADLRMSITSPEGTVVNLVFGNSEAPTVNLANFVLDQFHGENPNGTWKVNIRDAVSGVTGRLDALTLRITERSDPTRFQYGAGGHLTAAFDPEGLRLFSIVYDAQGRVVEQDDGIDTNLPARFSYTENAQGVTTVYRDRLGNESQYVHDTAHHLLSVTDPLNRTTGFMYNGANRRLLIDALGRNTSIVYDNDGNVITVTGPRGGQYNMTYDSNRNLLTIRDPNGNTTTFAYDSNNNPRAVTDALGNRDTKTWTSDSKLSGNLMADGGGMNYTYSAGMPTGASHAATGAKSGAGYDLSGRVTTLTDADGFETEITYDSQGREIRKENALGHAEETTYDRRGRVVEYKDFNGNITRFTYDNNDNLLTVRDPLGRTVRYEYDGEDRMVKTIAPGGATARIVYDAAGQVIAETDPLGNTVTYEYDAAGNRTASYDAKGDLIEKIFYNSLDLPSAIEDADGNRVTMDYDAAHRPRFVRNALGRRVDFTFDDIDRPVEFKDPLGRVAKREFEKDDVVSRLTDPKGQGVRFFYDPANRLTGVELQHGSIRYQYNDRDLVTQFRTPTGRTFNYTYDGAGRVTQIAPGGPNSGGTDTLRYNYDANGNVLSVESSGGQQGIRSLTRQYDALDRVTRYTDSEGNTLRYRYDDVGNLSEIVYPDGKQVFYTYDDANRLTEVRDWAGRRTRYQYDANSRVSRIDFPNGTSRVMAYDPRGRILRRQDRTSAGEIIVDYRYSYDADGKLGVANMAGNAPQLNVSGATYSYDNSNRMTAYNGQTVTVNQDGQVTRGPLGANFGDFQYDFRGNLIRAGSTNMIYNGEDRLTGFFTGTGITRLVVNPLQEMSQVLVKTDPSGAVTRYVWGIGLAYEVVESGNRTRVYHYDDRGSVVAITGSNGSVEGRMAYTPYGSIAYETGDTDTLFKFQGLFGVISAPGEGNLSLMGLRWYSAQMRRFLTEDPYFGTIEKIGSLNRYAYAGNDPINRFDPSGKFWNLIGAAVGAVVGVAVQATTDLIKGEFSGWEAYAGAAIGGAVAGFIVSSTGCVACAGAAGSATEYLVTQGLRGDPVDPVELLVTAGLGAAFGKIGDKAGKVLGAGAKAASKSLSKALGRQAARPLAQRFSRRALKEALRREASKVRWEKVVSEIPEEFATGLAEDVSKGVIFRDDEATPGASRPASLPASFQQGGQRLNRGRNQSYGEFIHWKFFLETLRLAAVPAPNNPNNLLTSF